MTNAATDIDALDRVILNCLKDGHTEQSTAKLANISHRTVQRRIQKLMRLHGVTSRFALGAMAQRAGLLDD